MAITGTPSSTRCSTSPITRLTEPSARFCCKGPSRCCRTEGSGIVRDPFGSVIRRCDIVTEGTADPSRQTIQLTETFTYDDGEVDVWRWVMTHARDGRYVAAESQAGAGITGQRVGDEYSLSFSRPTGAARGVASPRYATRFTMLAQDVALKSVRVSLFGLPIGAMTAIHRRVD